MLKIIFTSTFKFFFLIGIIIYFGPFLLKLLNINANEKEINSLNQCFEKDVTRVRISSKSYEYKLKEDNFKNTFNGEKNNNKYIEENNIWLQCENKNIKSLYENTLTPTIYFKLTNYLLLFNKKLSDTNYHLFFEYTLDHIQLKLWNSITSNNENNNTSNLKTRKQTSTITQDKIKNNNEKKEDYENIDNEKEFENEKSNIHPTKMINNIIFKYSIKIMKLLLFENLLKLILILLILNSIYIVLSNLVEVLLILTFKFFIVLFFGALIYQTLSISFIKLSEINLKNIEIFIHIIYKHTYELIKNFIKTNDLTIILICISILTIILYFTYLKIMNIVMRFRNWFKKDNSDKTKKLFEMQREEEERFSYFIPIRNHTIYSFLLLIVWYIIFISTIDVKYQNKI
jgi:hypothetical protein